MTRTHLLLATDGSEPSLEAARLVRDLLPGCTALPPGGHGPCAATTVHESR